MSVSSIAKQNRQRDRVHDIWRIPPFANPNTYCGYSWPWLSEWLPKPKQQKLPAMMSNMIQRLLVPSRTVIVISRSVFAVHILTNKNRWIIPGHRYPVYFTIPRLFDIKSVQILQPSVIHVDQYSPVHRAGVIAGGPHLHHHYPR